MKKCFLLFYLFILQFILLASDTTKIRIAILPFSARGNVEKSLVELASENFAIKIIEIGKYSVVERSQLDKALSELKFQYGDAFDDSSAVEIGKLAGAQIVIIGNITALGTLGSDFYVSARGIDVKTGVAMFAKREEAKSRRGLVIAIDKLAISISNENNNKTSKGDKDDLKDDAKNLVNTRNAEREEKLKADRDRQELLRLELEMRKKEREEKAKEERERKEAERQEKLKADRDRQELLRLELEKARLEKEKLEQERQERARLEKERLERERQEQAKLEQERQEKQRLEQEKQEKIRLERERQEQAKLERERQEEIKLEKERQEQIRLENERQERLRLERERQEQAKLERERQEQVKLEQKRQEEIKLEKERQEQIRLENERQEKIRLEQVKQEQTKLEQERQEKLKLERERQEQIRLEQKEKARLEREKEILEKAEKNINISDESKFTKGEGKFIDIFYERKWKFSLDDRDSNLLKYKQFIGFGTALIASGVVIIAGGVTSMVFMLTFVRTTNYLYDYHTEVKKSHPYFNIGIILGGSIVPVGVILCAFSVIPFWFANMIATIYKKETGRKLAFFERVNLNIGFVIKNNNFNEMENRLNMSFSISL